MVITAENSKYFWSNLRLILLTHQFGAVSFSKDSQMGLIMVYPRQASIEVLHVFVKWLTLFTSFYMMHVKFFMHEMLTAAGKFYKIFPNNIQNLNATDTFQFLQISKYYTHSKFCYRNDLFISRIPCCAP